MAVGMVGLLELSVGLQHTSRFHIVIIESILIEERSKS